MAISSFEKQCDKIQSKYSSSSPRGSVLPSCQLVKLSIATDGSITSSDSKSAKTKKKSGNVKSPYLTGDSVQMLSRVAEKKLYSHQKKASDIVSSFPLAANIYKANSDEFKSQKKGIKKVKKSVLTLPNAPTANPQTCTVSDMNDSEYYNGSDTNRKVKAKKRFVAQNKKSRVRNKDYEFYDRDARYCSQMNINLDCSSTDIINLNGDGRNVAGKLRRGKSPQIEQEFNAHDVWAVLRNINRFQFRPSPPISEDSIHTPKKKKIRNKRRNNRKDTRVIETCRTEEFAYISSFEVDSKSPMSFSHSSSFDRITVIDKQDEYSEICKEFKKSVMTTKNLKVKNRYPSSTKNPSRNNAKNNLKLISQQDETKEHVPLHKNIKDCNNSLDIKPYNFKSKDNDFDNMETLISKDYQEIVKCPNTKDSKHHKNLDGINVIIKRANEYDYALCSDSSKVGITTAKMERKDLDKLPNVASDESGQLVKGITKVILSKGQSIQQQQVKRNEIMKRKPRLATTMPSTTIMPKLTQTEIKRRLANLKFPIVILGKEQVCSTPIQVMNNDPLHLDGLNQPIWPFMKEWFNQTNLSKDNAQKDKKAIEKNEERITPKNKHHAIDRKNNLRKIYEVNEYEQPVDNDKACLNNIPNKKKALKRPVPPNEITKIKPQPNKKPKPIHELKDKMLKLLYKNTSARDIDEQYKISYQRDSFNDPINAVEAKIASTSTKVDVSTETVTQYEFVPQNLFKNVNVCPRLDTKKMLVSKQPWAKAKWASDFIENVIKKIRSGVYYNQENKCSRKALKTGLKEASVQTVLLGINLTVNKQPIKEHFQDKSINKEVAIYGKEEDNYLDTLPGFDDVLPALEIKTLNMREVAVKYCTTNVMVQFDVSVPSGPEKVYPIQKSSSYIPLAVTESHTKIFKCKTTIVNAMLPAEICSLLPKIIQSIIDTNKQTVLPPAKSPNDSLLYTISELSHCESTDIFISTLPPSMTSNVSPYLLQLLKGVFTAKTKCAKLRNNIPKVGFTNLIVTKGLLLNVSIQRMNNLINDSIILEMPKANLKRKVSMMCEENISTNTCTTLALYQKRNSILNDIFNNNLKVVANLWLPQTNFRLNIPNLPFSLNVTVGQNGITMNFTNIDQIIANNHDEEDAIQGKSTRIGDANIDSLYNGFKPNNSTQFRAIEYNNNIGKNTPNKKDPPNKLILSTTKTRKRNYVKLYKKCKSTSNISGERYSTSLNKIINLDDFFQALGSGKILSSVFDGLSGKKILSSIIEMKNWITDISQRQAMLVLLLTNKKDTPNLVRFRPILLQGIAVNRITRASELDMEIEVIEREHFNKFSQYEGISYIQECVEKNDNIIEELYWIAKTTASDYQRPFNEASEKLLKSLVEKRKKLNPSYLRVMARYVGLGLLKSSNKN